MRQAGLGIGAPDVSWTPPQSLPDRLEGPIGFDTETRDDGLGAGLGPGWAWDGGGYLVGVSIWADNWRGYLPVAHEGGGNLDPALVRRWLREVFAKAPQVKIGANVLYDLGWLQDFGVEVRGPFYDVQYAEALIDEHRRRFNLDSIAFDRLGRKKDETALREAAAAWNLDPKAELWRLPARNVGGYAETDAELPRLIRDEQRPDIERDNLADVVDLEHSLIPLYLSMRRRGVRIDEDRVARLEREWLKRRADALERIKRTTGKRIDPWNAESIAQALEPAGIRFKRTPTGKVSVTKEQLENIDHDLTRATLEARNFDRLVGTFLRGQIQAHVRNGRIHAEFHPLRQDDGGTITGRGSMSHPNLQQVPARTAEGLEVRRCFLPEEGFEWYAPDYSQQEPRLLIHFAALTRRNGRPLPGVEEAVQRFHADRAASYHRHVSELTGIDYNDAKQLNLAIIYGRGIQSTARGLGISKDEAAELFERHKRAIPFASIMSGIAKDRARETGRIRTLAGRVCRFPFWESGDFEKHAGELAPSREAAVERFGPRVRRAWLHKALNRLVQGSAADQMKMAMRAVLEAGLGETVAVQVHDELGLTSAEPAQAKEVARIMAEAVDLKVPSVVDLDHGPTWGDAK